MMIERAPSVNRTPARRLGGLCRPAEWLRRLPVMQVGESANSVRVRSVEVQKVAPRRHGDGVAEVLAGPRRQDELELRRVDLGIHEVSELGHVVRGEL